MSTTREGITFYEIDEDQINQIMDYLQKRWDRDGEFEARDLLLNLRDITGIDWEV